VYRVTARTPTQQRRLYSPPLDIQLPSLEVVIHKDLLQDEQVQLRFQELDPLEEGRFHALQNLELHR
jgi:hypothetical protein